MACGDPLCISSTERDCWNGRRLRRQLRTLRPLTRREHASDDLPCLLDGDVVGYGAGGGLGQDGVGVAEEGVLLVLVFVFDAEGAAHEGEVVLDLDGVVGFEAAHVTLAAVVEGGVGVGSGVYCLLDPLA